MISAVAPGSVIDGFRLGEKIHTGSMATIFRLTGPGGPLPLVMKIPRLGARERTVNVIGFEVCRTVLGALPQGPHHPTLIAYGDIETTPYLVMEFVEGARLNDLLHRAPMAPEEIARLGAAIAMAMYDIHLQDVVHLDLKPTNVIFRPGGEAVLIDFGLARHGHYPDLLAEELRIPLGNWVYMAPEQVLGVRCDPRSDIYALGGMLYELATARTPFGMPRTVAELRRRVYRDPLPPRGIVPSTPEWLQEIILQCLEIDARHRFSSADAVAFALSNPATVELTERASRRRRDGLWKLALRRMEASAFEPAPCPPLSFAARAARVVAVAIAPQESNERVREALRAATRCAMAGDPHCRVACVTVVPTAAMLSGPGDENSATGRHIHRLIELRNWAKPLELPEERVTCHVLESDNPAAALLDYVTMNEVDHVLIGAPKDSTPPRRLSGICAQVVGAARCTVTVVRSRTEG